MLGKRLQRLSANGENAASRPSNGCAASELVAAVARRWARLPVGDVPLVSRIGVVFGRPDFVPSTKGDSMIDQRA
jgi:hypothetical protein